MLQICKFVYSTRNLKGGMWSLFDPCVNAMAQQPYWPSHIKVSYYTFGFGSVIRGDLRTLSLPHVLPHNKVHVCVILNPRGKGNSRLVKLFGGFSYKNIRRYNNFPPYVMVRWPPQQIPPLNFFCVAWSNKSMQWVPESIVSVHSD